MAYYSDMVNRRTAVYRIYDGPGGNLLYVGLTLNVDTRLASHRRRDWWPETPDVAVQWFDGRVDAKAAEWAAIRDESPRHNIVRPKSANQWREVCN